MPERDGLTRRWGAGTPVHCGRPGASRQGASVSGVADGMALTGLVLDRVDDAQRRDPDWCAAQRSSPGARALVLGDAGVRGTAEGVELVPLADIDLRGLPEPVLLGLDAAGPVYAVDEAPPAPGRRPPLVGAGGMRGEAPPESAGRVGLRVAAQVLPHGESALVAYAAALLNWHRAHPHCSICGTATVVGDAGLLRRCPECGTSHHPRTDPVVIMLVTDGAARVLLGRQAVWPAGRYSTLAGFVAPGEALEEAVAREVREEVGVEVGAPEYVASQPWPFPTSLMLGFHVPWAGGEIGVGDDELEHAAWFSRAEVEAAIGEDGWDASPDHQGGLLLPPRSAIARHLIERWLARTAAS